MSEYERLKAWLESLGASIMSQSVTVEDGVAVIEEDVDVPPEAVVLLDDIYGVLKLKDAPWIIEEDVGEKRIVKFPVVGL